MTSKSFNITKCKIAPLSKQINVFIFEAEIMKAISHVKVNQDLNFLKSLLQNSIFVPE